MWWGGFLLCGLLLILVAIPFFSFPKVLTVSNEAIYVFCHLSFKDCLCDRYLSLFYFRERKRRSDLWRSHYLTLTQKSSHQSHQLMGFPKVLRKMEIQDMARISKVTSRPNFLVLIFYFPFISLIMRVFVISIRHTQKYVALGDKSCVRCDLPGCLHGTCDCFRLCRFPAQVSRNSVQLG